MRTLRSLLLVWRHAFAHAMRGRRLAALLLLAALPALVAWILTGGHDNPRPNHFAQMVFYLVLQGVAPLAGLLLGVAVLGDEIEGRTITYLFTRPIPRPVVFVARWLGCVTGFALLLAASVGVAGGLFAGRVELTAAQVGGTAAIAAAGFLVYAAVFAALRAFFQRALYIGFFVGFIFEGMISKLPATNLSRCSVWHHLVLLETRLLDGLPFRHPAGLLPGESTAASLQILAGILLAALAAGAWRVKSSEIRIPTAVA